MSKKSIDSLFCFKFFSQNKVAFFFSFWINSSWSSRLCPDSTLESSFKITIIINFIHTLTWVNLSWPSNSWPEPCPESTSKLDFKTMIVTTFILALIRVNCQLDQLRRSCTRSTPKSGFQTMIITTSIFTLT